MFGTGFTSGLNSAVVKTELDDVFYQQFNAAQHPNDASVETVQIFKQDTADSSAVILEIFKGVGSFESRNEEQDVPSASPRINNKKTVSIVDYDKVVYVPKMFFDDNKHGSYEAMITNFGRRARTTKNRDGFGVLRGSHATYQTADAAYIISDAHTALSGDTIDNKLTGVLDDSSLEDGIQKLYEQEAQDGEIDGHLAETLVVPAALYPDAVELTGSLGQVNTMDNNLNVFSAKYNIFIGTSAYLGAAAGGSDVFWWLLSETHSLTRWVRESVWTGLVDFMYDPKNRYQYKGGYRESVACISYEGILGSDGTT